jgi:hypothetical protein
LLKNSFFLKIGSTAESFCPLFTNSLEYLKAPCWNALKTLYLWLIVEGFNLVTWMSGDREIQA